MASKRKAYQQQQRKQKQARRRNLLIIGGVILVAVIAVVLLVTQNDQPITAGSFVTVEPKEYPQANGKALGPDDAPVVLRDFSDFQCPFCRQFATGGVKDRIIEEFVSTGQVRFEYRHFIVIDGNVGGSESRRAAEASECAAEQNRFWQYHDMLFANQRGEGNGAFSDSRLKAFAETIGLDTGQFNDCFDSRKYRRVVEDDEKLARSYSLTGTPSLVVNDKLVQNPLDFSIVTAAITAALATAD
jgi:protein-disulfide isomerase